jgi:uncharacterized membrane protein (UPF0127 family)
MSIIRLRRLIRRENTSRDGWYMLNSRARASGLSRGLAVFSSICILTATSLSGCQTRLPRVTLQAAGQELTVEVARTDAQRERGLMGRKGIGPREGMIFVFDRDDHLSFWMKNTSTALSIAFLSAEGKVLQIADMEPFSEKIIRSRLSARYALEMRQGAFAEMRITEGTIVTFPAGFPN